MGSFKKFITEAVGIETVKKALVGQPIWDYKGELIDEFDGKYRKIIGRIEPNIRKDLEEHPLYNKLEKIFVEMKYILTKESYIKGYVTKDKQQFKIGKILKRLSEQQHDDIFKGHVLGLLESFRDDPLRQANRKPYLVVVSKHPYDVLGASTDRNWSSCIDLGETIYYKKDTKGGEKRRGSNADILLDSLHAPFMVAYLVDPDDVNTAGKVMIQRPLGRILIYPFLSEDGDVYNWSIGDSYGVEKSEFRDIVRNWVQQLNEQRPVEGGIFKKIGDVFYDSFDDDMVRTSRRPEEIIDDLKQALVNIEIADGIIEDWDSKHHRVDLVVYGVILSNFVEKSNMQSDLWGDHVFYDDFILPFIKSVLLETDIYYLFNSYIGYFDIYRIYDDTGSIHLDPIPIKYIEDYIEKNYDADTIIEDYGQYYQVEIFAEVLQKLDNSFQYYKNKFNYQFKDYINELSKLIQEQLIEIGIDPQLKNWKQIDTNILYSKSQILIDDIII